MRTRTHLGWLTLAAVCALLSGALARAQSSANYRLESGRLTSSTSSTTPASTNFRASGGVDAAGVSGIAASTNFGASSGVPPVPTLDAIFTNGFE